MCVIKRSGEGKGEEEEAASIGGAQYRNGGGGGEDGASQRSSPLLRLAWITPIHSLLFTKCHPPAVPRAKPKMAFSLFSLRTGAFRSAGREHLQKNYNRGRLKRSVDPVPSRGHQSARGRWRSDGGQSKAAKNPRSLSRDEHLIQAEEDEPYRSFRIRPCYGLQPVTPSFSLPNETSRRAPSREGKCIGSMRAQQRGLS